MPLKRVILELGAGNDLHGGDYTKAALRAVQDAFHHSSLSLIRSLDLDPRSAQVEVTIGVQQFVAREVPLVDKPAVSAVILKSRDEAAQPFGRIQNSLGLVALLGLAAAAIAGFFIARMLSATFN